MNWHGCLYFLTLMWFTSLFVDGDYSSCAFYLLLDIIVLTLVLALKSKWNVKLQHLMGTQWHNHCPIQNNLQQQIWVLHDLKYPYLCHCNIVKVEALSDSQVLSHLCVECFFIQATWAMFPQTCRLFCLSLVLTKTMSVLTRSFSIVSTLFCLNIYECLDLQIFFMSCRKR